MFLLSEYAEKDAVEISNMVKAVEFAAMKAFEDEFLEALFFRTDAVC